MDLVFPLLTTSADLAIAIFLAFLPCRMDGCNLYFRVVFLCHNTGCWSTTYIDLHDLRFTFRKP